MSALIVLNGSINIEGRFKSSIGEKQPKRQYLDHPRDRYSRLPVMWRLVEGNSAVLKVITLTSQLTSTSLQWMIALKKMTSMQEVRMMPKLTQSWITRTVLDPFGASHLFLFKEVVTYTIDT